MLLVCPRCQARGLQRHLNGSDLECRACGTHFPAETASVDGDGGQCVIWREGSRRCELWTVNGEGRLRVYDGDTLTLDEPCVRGQGWARAAALRQSGDKVASAENESEPHG